MICPPICVAYLPSNTTFHWHWPFPYSLIQTHASLQSHSTDHLHMNAFKQQHIPLALTMPHSVTCKFTQSKLSFNWPLHSVIITVTYYYYHTTTLMTKPWYCWTVCTETTHTCGPMAQKMTSVQLRQYIVESLLDWIQSCVSVLWHCCLTSDITDNAAILWQLPIFTTKEL